jgi:hypothetical protein
MKSATILSLATAVAAEYGYGSAPKTSSKLGYTTVYPGYGKQPVTVTAQYQPVPTYVNGKWSHYEAISTVITDVHGNKITVTKTEQDVTVYHSKTTLTHTKSAPIGGYAKPTGYGASAYANSTKPQTWNELYEEIHYVPYNHMGPHALPGYAGNPKAKETKDQQAVKIKKYQGGKWAEYDHTFTYNAPKPSVTTYDAPGTYTVPAKDITVAYPTTVTATATYTAKANKPVTYGGQITSVSKPTTITAHYPAYETHGTVTKTVIKSTTVACPNAGKYTIVKPTTTVYKHDTTVSYPQVTKYPAGVYHHEAETVTITKSHQPYTCSFEQTSAYPVVTPPAYSAYPDAYSTVPVYSDKPSSTGPSYPDPSSDYDEPIESYGHANAGYVKRGGVLERRKAESGPAKPAAKFAILV